MTAILLLYHQYKKALFTFGHTFLPVLPSSDQAQSGRHRRVIVAASLACSGPSHRLPASTPTRHLRLNHNISPNSTTSHISVTTPSNAPPPLIIRPLDCHLRPRPTLPFHSVPSSHLHPHPLTKILHTHHLSLHLHSPTLHLQPITHPTFTFTFTDTSTQITTPLTASPCTPALRLHHPAPPQHAPNTKYDAASPPPSAPSDTPPDSAAAAAPAVSAEVVTAARSAAAAAAVAAQGKKGSQERSGRVLGVAGGVRGVGEGRVWGGVRVGVGGCLGWRVG